jgi:hypothetical protein
MPKQSDWPLLSEAYNRLDGSDGSVAAAFDIIGRGQVPVSAYRSNVTDNMSGLPERIETLLGEARQGLVQFPLSEIYALFDGEAEPWARFFAARVRWPELVDKLEAAGFAVAELGESARSEQRLGTKRAKRRSHQPRRGPKPGETGFNAADKALFETIERMQKKGEARSAIAGARILVKKGKVASSGGSDENRAVRVARRYGQWRSPRAEG